MVDTAEKCVQQDLSRMLPPTHRDWPGVWLEPKDDNLLELKGYIMGQEDTPFYGGRFEIEATVPPNFPRQPPKFHLLTPIWHPNIDAAAGEICLNVLHQSWTQNLSLGAAMLCIQLFFDTPEPLHPLETCAGIQLITSKQMYNETVAFWTYEYAMNEQTRTEENRKANASKLALAERLVAEKKINKRKAIYALSCYDWVYDDAKELSLPTFAKFD